MKYYLILFLHITILYANNSHLQDKIDLIDKKESIFLSMIQIEYIKVQKKHEKIRLATLRQEKIRYAFEHETSFLALRLKSLIKSHLTYATLLCKEEKKRVQKKEKKRIQLAKKKQRQLLAKIDISQQRMRVYRGDELLYKWKISSGKKGHATPRGKYKAMFTVKDYKSRAYNNAPMPYSVFFKYGYAIHGTNSVNRLGSPASHGCIRLRTKNAKKFYTLVRKMGKKNTMIRISN